MPKNVYHDYFKRKRKDLRDRIIHLARAGYSSKKIAEEFNFRLDNVQKVLKEWRQEIYREFPDLFNERYEDLKYMKDKLMEKFDSEESIDRKRRLSQEIEKLSKEMLKTKAFILK